MKIPGGKYVEKLFKYIFRKNYNWTTNNFKKIRKKGYKSYNEYLEHQEVKLQRVNESKWLKRYDQRYHSILRDRLHEHGFIRPGMNVLCLAARLGTEVKAFLDHGCFAVGIDVNPGSEQNKYVVYGDFHNIQYPDSSVDVIFTNSIDHAFDLSSLIQEIKRVLKPNGYLIIEIVSGENEGRSAGYYESIEWKSIDDIIKLFKHYGFQVLKRVDISYPWNGQHICAQIMK